MTLVLLALLAACFEAPLGEGECRADTDCADPMSCYDADDPYCGAGPDIQRDCEDDPSCGDGNVCEAYLSDDDCSFGELSSRCVPACTGDGDCGDGWCVNGNCFDTVGFRSTDPR